MDIHILHIHKGYLQEIKSGEMFVLTPIQTLYWHFDTHRHWAYFPMARSIPSRKLGVCGAMEQCDPFMRDRGNTGDAWQRNLTTDDLMVGEIPTLRDGSRQRSPHGRDWSSIREAGENAASP